MGVRLATVPFATTALLSEYLQEDVPVDSPLAQLALLGASHAIQNYIGQTLFYVATDVEVLDGTGSDTMLLPELPVLDVAEVILDVDLDGARPLLGPENLSNADYDWSDSGLLFRRTGRSTYGSTFGKWPNRRRCIQVTYTHGFQVGGLAAVRVAGAGSNVAITVPGYDTLNADTLITVFDETTDTLLTAVPFGTTQFKTATVTTGETLLVTYDQGVTLPADIQLICAAIAGRTWAQDGATQESAGAYNASYAGQPATLTADEMKILDQYGPARRR